MFENSRRGRQARNFRTNVPKIVDLKSNRYFPKIDVGCPCFVTRLGKINLERIRKTIQIKHNTVRSIDRTKAKK